MPKSPLLPVVFLLPGLLCAQAAVDGQNAGDPLYVRAKNANAAFAFSSDRDYGFVDVNTNVDNAAFYLGTFFVSKAPIQNLKLPQGSYEYKITLDRCENVTGNISVSAKEKQTIDKSLVLKKGVVNICTSPAGATVQVGGTRMGTTSDGGLAVGNLSSGTYRVRFEKKGYQPVERMLKIVNGEKSGLYVFLQKNYGSVRVESREAKCYVYVNNIYWGRAPFTVNNLRPGKAEVRVECRNFAPFSQNVMIQSDQTSTVSASLRKDRSYKDIGPYGELKGSWGDKDGDALLDDDDQCPEDPEDPDGFQDQDGCPDPDNDNDGVSDIKEMDNKYRDMPEDFDGFQDKDGMPDFDNDQDGVPDSVDACPSQQEDRDGFEEADGCPDFDNDADGTADSTDLSPNDPEDKDGFQDTDGAPDLDNDNDGVRDYMDRCPNAAEVFNNWQDDDGCPDVKVPEPRMGIVSRIPYELNADLPEPVFAGLDSVYNAMLVYPAVEIEIKVHCDNKGKQKRKTEETQQKAQIIAQYLVYRGLVDPARYNVRGIGGAEPVASNVSEEGRAKNTRVEIKRLK